MKIREYTSEDYPSIVEIHNSLSIAWPEQPRTPEGWAAVDKNRNPNSKQKRWGLVEDGRVVGFASYVQSPWSYPPESFYINIEVHPDFQRRTIGMALYDQVMDEVQTFNPPALRADAFTNLPRVVILSVHAMESEQEARAAGADAIIVKRSVTRLCYPPSSDRMGYSSQMKKEKNHEH